MMDDEILTGPMEGIEQELARINDVIEKLSRRDWTQEIADSVRAGDGRCDDILEAEKYAEMDLRLFRGKVVAYTQRISELKEEEQAAKLQKFRDDHADTIAEMNKCFSVIGANWDKVQAGIERFAQLREQANLFATNEAAESGLPAGGAGVLPVPQCITLGAIAGQMITTSKTAAAASVGFVAPYWSPAQHHFSMIEITGDSK